ncbi:hypothetical protein HaLaN_04204 [Haematococcus lacustris]|uniref:Uncharacterized protein n=1 Tax=Haematococcus lacustris TaxID=44745 RepID=A0A699YQ89_HAELA|nr:hypothetical protein HaLaN_04204 [Haematococcus lacustris]
MPWQQSQCPKEVVNRLQPHPGPAARQQQSGAHGQVAAAGLLSLVRQQPQARPSSTDTMTATARRIIEGAQLQMLQLQFLQRETELCQQQQEHAVRSAQLASVSEHAAGQAGARVADEVATCFHRLWLQHAVLQHWHLVRQQLSALRQAEQRKALQDGQQLQ